MGSKVSPAYILKSPSGKDFTDDERQGIVDAVKANGPQEHIIVEELEDGTPLLLHDPRPVRTLYHYTSQRHWERIQQDGYLRLGPHGFVALTDQPNLRPASPDAHWATSGPLDKTQVRISWIGNQADSFLPYCEQFKVDPEWVAKQTKQDSPEHWYVLDRPIPSNEWVEVRLGDTPIAKRPLGRRRRDTSKPLWQTGSGRGSKCDFCSADENAGACYRYECREFELDGWHNGNPDSTDLGEADWAACWECSTLIQKRDIPNLLARADEGMRGERVEMGGKHGTDSGFYNKRISEARIRAFFQYYTKKRWFVGRCDFCSARGESVRWQYDCGRFRAEHPIDGLVTVSDTPWCMCEECSKLIERNKQKAMVERGLDYQIARAEQEEGFTFDSVSRARARQRMIFWVDTFFKSKRGKRYPIADLPPRTEIPVASIPAQAALDEQTTLLRWLEGSEGRRHLGGWNDRYEEKPDWTWDRRDARPDELMPWTLPLRHGEAFYWEPQTAAWIRQAAEELQDNPDVPFIMRPQVLPAPYGFFYSDEPLGQSAGFPCRAIGWAIVEHPQAMRRKNLDKGGSVTEMSIQMWPGGGGSPDEADGIILTFWSNRPQDSTLRPSGQVLWSFGVDFRKAVGFVNTEAEAIKDGTPLYEQSTMVAALFQFIQQRIVIAGRGQPVGAAIRKRIEREYPEHPQTVRVVTLRRTQRADYHRPDEPTDRSISVQFKVRGHWRNQCFNTAGHADAEKAGVGCNDHMTIYVHEFFKGEDLPPKEGAARVFDVAR